MSSASSSAMFKNVCLGGTFDGIHAGHKKLFGEALKLCNQRLIVGVTDHNMIKKKILWELILPVEERVQLVRNYLQDLNPSLTYHVVPIGDIYGPTIEIEDLDAIVVSDETKKGADIINDARSKKNWRKLKVFIVDLLKDISSNHQDELRRLNEAKVSSSIMRMDKLGTILREPQPNDNIPKKPYMIGLTGGIASGKTAIGEYLKTLGFGYVNYDILGHKTYEIVGSPIYNEIVEFFGDSVLDPHTGKIDRPKLGKIVFADKSKLNRLNEMVWPGIYALVDAEVERLKANHEVIVLESALLIESKQTKRVHQIWTTIVPPEEAIKRQIESRGLSHEEAARRVNAQINNYTRVQASNVVFCSLWEAEFTKQQVSKAVRELRNKYLVN